MAAQLYKQDEDSALPSEKLLITAPGKRKRQACQRKQQGTQPKVK